jgi:hypothetical protein
LSDQVNELEQLVRGRFSVKQFFALPEGELEFQLAYDDDTKLKFAELSSELLPKGYTPHLSGTRDECVLVLRKGEVALASRSRLPVIFALFTAATLVVFALLQQEVYAQLAPSLPAYAVVFGFGATIAAILGAHELGQRYAARRRGGGHASSYLIPAIPFLPPFLPSLGFVATQHRPAVNRDSLFDTVIAGPLAIFGLAVILYALGDLTSVQSVALAPGSQLANSTVSINPNAIQLGIDSVLRPLMPSLPISPIADGATVGFIMVFIGLLPMAFYDGGFLAAAAWGESPARIASYLSVVVLLALDTPTYWALAVVVLLLAGRPFKLKVLDEVSALSPYRRWLLLGCLALAFLCLPVPHNLGTLPLT